MYIYIYPASYSDISGHSTSAEEQWSDEQMAGVALNTGLVAWPKTMEKRMDREGVDELMFRIRDEWMKKIDPAIHRGWKISETTKNWWFSGSNC